MFHNVQEAREAYKSHVARHEDLGAYLGGNGPDGRAVAYLPDAWKDKNRGYSMALDAQPALSTDPSAGIPWFMTNYVDPAIYKILFAPTEGANIYGEERKGDWLTNTAMFPVVEHTGETSSYGDYANNGMTNLNTNFPQRQNYLFQTVKMYGERELAIAGEARINWVSEMDASAANNMKRFENLAYFYGIAGLQNYGGVNDPNLSASLTPALKAYGGTAWFVGNVLKATPNEVYTDCLTLYTALVNGTGGLVDDATKIKLAMGPGIATAMKATNSFGVNTYDLLKENLPNIEFKTATQFNQTSASNPQGIVAGNLMQMIATEIEGQKTVFAAYSEKMRSHTIIREMSAFKQKTTGGVWGTIWRMPVASQTMVGL